MFLSGSAIGNYTLVQPTGLKGNISPKVITISPNTGQNKIVKDPDPVFAYIHTPALVEGDSFTGALGRVAGEDPGYYNYTMGTLSAGANYSLELTATPSTFAIIQLSQTIPLVAGWNIISSAIIPDDANLKTIFQSLIDSKQLKKVMNESGGAIEDWGEENGGWHNGISGGNILATEGYQVNVQSNCNLTVKGNFVALPLTIDLLPGWNIISYPALNNQDGKSVVQALIDAGKLVKVMDEKGSAIEDWGSGIGWQNGIGNFVPGKGYLVNVNSACTLTIKEVLNKSAIYVPRLLASTHFKTAFSGNGVEHMNINLVELNSSGMQQGDEIGVFDGAVCVGAVTLGAEQMNAGTVSIPVSANDGLSKTVNGYTAGNPITLKLYSNGVKSQLKMEVLQDGIACFKKGKSLFVKATTDAVTAVSGLATTMNVKFYPNPFTDVLSIEINSSGEEDIDILIYDAIGRLVRSLYKGTTEGNQVFLWDGTNDQGHTVKPGVYYLRCKGLTFNGIIKR